MVYKTKKNTASYFVKHLRVYNLMLVHIINFISVVNDLQQKIEISVYLNFVFPLKYIEMRKWEWEREG